MPSKKPKKRKPLYNPPSRSPGKLGGAVQKATGLDRLQKVLDEGGKSRRQQPKKKAPHPDSYAAQMQREAEAKKKREAEAKKPKKSWWWPW